MDYKLCHLQKYGTDLLHSYYDCVSCRGRLFLVPYEDNLNRKFDMARNNLVNRLQKTIAPDVPEPKWHVGGFTQPSQKMVSKWYIN